MAGGRPVLVSLGSKAAYGYDPATGQELWRIVDRSAHSPSTRPLAGHGLVFYQTGWRRGAGSREAGRYGRCRCPTDVIWRVTRAVPNKPSVPWPAISSSWSNDAGIVTCLEAQTGKSVWQSRLKGEYSASPLVAAGRDLLLQRRRASDGDRGWPRAQGARRESARRRLHGVAGRRRGRADPAVAHPPVPDRVAIPADSSSASTERYGRGRVPPVSHAASMSALPGC